MKKFARSQRLCSCVLSLTLLAACTPTASFTPFSSTGVPSSDSASVSASLGAQSTAQTMPQNYREDSTYQEISQMLSDFDDSTTLSVYRLVWGLLNRNHGAIVKAISGENSDPTSALTFDFYTEDPFERMPVCTSVTPNVTDVNGEKVVELTLMVESAGSTGFPIGSSTYLLRFADGRDSAYPKGVVKSIVPYALAMFNLNNNILPAAQIIRLRSFGTTECFASTEELRSSAGLFITLLVELQTADGAVAEKGASAATLAKAAKQYFNLDHYIPLTLPANDPITQNANGNYVLSAIDGGIATNYNWMFSQVEELPQRGEGYFDIYYTHQGDALSISTDEVVCYTVKRNADKTYQILSCRKLQPKTGNMPYVSYVPSGSSFDQPATQNAMSAMQAVLDKYRSGEYPQKAFPEACPPPFYQPWPSGVPIPLTVNADQFSIASDTAVTGDEMYGSPHMYLHLDGGIVLDCRLGAEDGKNASASYFAIYTNAQS